MSNMMVNEIQPISATDVAVAHFRKMLKKQFPGEEAVIRLSVKNSGCSGKSYVIDVTKKKHIQSDDNVFELAPDIILCVDSQSLTFLAGTEIDYIKKNLLEGQLIFKNPHEKSQCGCGESFYV